MEDFELTKKPDMGIFDRRFPIRLGSDPTHDPTKMTIIQGTDGVLDDLFSYQVYNKLKNHWRLGVEPADKQAGMIWSDLDDNKLYHYGAAWEEILQLTRSLDVSPQFATVRLMDTGGDHYLDLKCNENLGAHRLLNIVVGDAARTITLSGSPTLGDWFDQDVKQASNVIFSNITANGKFKLGISTELTISGGGAITVMRSYHSVDGAGDAADNLDTINGGAEGMILILTAENVARAITVRHGVGNIQLDGAANFVMNIQDNLTLIYDGANWGEISRASN